MFKIYLLWRELWPTAQKMYTTVLHAVTQALEELEKQNFGAAKECLLSAQLMAEGIYLQSAGTEE